MIVVKLMGGLGNQMFQYAFGKNLAIKNNTHLKVDTAFLLDRTPREGFVFRDFDLDIFTLKADTVAENEVEEFKRSKPFFSRLLSGGNSNTTIINEKVFHFDPSAVVMNKNSYASGYWQSEKYFQEIEAIIRKEFSFKTALNEFESELNSEILNTNSVCINFRRTDFVHVKNSADTHGATELSYYENAIQLITSKVENVHFFIFSDDIEWCKLNVKTNFPTTFVGHEYKGEKFSSYFQLMINCKHFIIPNSTFAWWAAWLSQNENKIVIAPKRWFLDVNLQNASMDIFPSSWIQLES